MFIRRTIFISTLGVFISLFSTVSQAQVPAQRLLTLILQRKHKEAEQLCKQPSIADMSQSDGHAYANYDAIVKIVTKTTKQDYYYPYLDLSESETQQCFSAAYDKEIEENTQGRYTFFHGQRWTHEWLTSLYKALYEAITEQTLATQYQFLRFKDPTSLQENEAALQQKLKKAADWNNPRYLFMNASLFGNAQNTGDCTAYYWYQNQSASYTRLTNRKIVRRCGASRTLYKKYQQELDALQTEHAALTTHGNLLLVSLSPQYCQEHVIESTISTNYTKNSTTGKTVASNLTLLKQNPNKVTNSDSRVYRLILTRNGTLMPSDNIRIFAFNGIEPAKWKAFCTKRDALFARIKQDIRALNQQKH